MNKMNELVFSPLCLSNAFVLHLYFTLLYHGTENNLKDKREKKEYS